MKTKAEIDARIHQLEDELADARAHRDADDGVRRRGIAAIAQDIADQKVELLNLH
jgi:hypothetical protein